MEEIKISELPEALELNDDDIVPVVQNGANKKVKMKKISKKENCYTLTVTETTDYGAQIELPAYYQSGKNTLEVYKEGRKLICTTAEDAEGKNGHYYEDGNEGDIVNTIHITQDNYLEEGDVFEFVIKGEYNL